MRKTGVKLMLAFLSFLAANGWIAGKGAAKGSASFFISAAVEETVVFVLLQLAVIVIYCIQPPAEKKSKVIYWLVSEALVLFTVLFWGIIIVGPIWLK